MEKEAKGLIINPKIKNVCGFLILSHSNILIGTISKDKKEINYKRNVDVFKKYRKGGAYAVLFARILLERIVGWVKLINDNI